MNEEEGRTYARLLEEAGRFHGDICRGIELGTRMTMAGLREIGITDPKGQDRKHLIVFAEIDRCATDAITALTGCRPGKRTMKIMDYGKMAATFVNMETGKAVRVVANLRDSVPDGVPLGSLPEEEVLSVTPVQVDLRPEDLPGRPVRVCVCDRCGEKILDARDIVVDGQTLCRPCYEGRTYFRPLGGDGVCK